MEATQIDNKLNYLEKNKINADSVNEDHGKYIKNNKLTLQTEQRLKSERHNVFTEEIN